MYQSIKLSTNKLIRQSLLKQTPRSYTILPLPNTRIHTPHTCTPLCPCHSIKLTQQSIRTASSITTMDTSHVDSHHDAQHDSHDEVYTNDGWLFGQDPSKPCNDPTDPLARGVYIPPVRPDITDDDEL